MAVEEGIASEVYHTILPSFLAACTRAASCAASSDVRAKDDMSATKQSTVFFINCLLCARLNRSVNNSIPAFTYGRSHYYEISCSVNIEIAGICSSRFTASTIWSTRPADRSKEALARNFPAISWGGNGSSNPPRGCG